MASEFLVDIEIDTGSLAGDKVARLREEEAARAKELAASGHLRALWRIPGRWANCGVWQAKDRQDLTEILETLPLRPYMTVHIRDLEQHPSDPRASVSPSVTEEGPGRTWVLPPLEPLRAETRSSRIREARTWQLEALPSLDLQRRTVPRGGNNDQVLVKTPALSATTATLDLDVTSLLRSPTGTDSNTRVFEMVKSAAEGASVTHSGALGLRTSASFQSDKDISIDVGAVTREPKVRTLPDGTESIQIRSIARLTLTANSAPSQADAGVLLLRLVADLKERQLLLKKEAS